MSDYISSFNTETRDILNYLSTKPEIADIYVKPIAPANIKEIENWENKNLCILPDDMKSFYLERDGVCIEWKIKIDDTPMSFGKTVLNAINDLTRIGTLMKDHKDPSLLDLEEIQEFQESDDFPHFDDRSRNFEVDNCNGYGKTCMVYKNTTPGCVAENAEFWFLDRSLQWHFITDTFTNYYRLLVSHLGLPQWQSLFTNDGLPPLLYQWYYMYAPGRIFIHNENWKNLIDTKQTKASLDVNRVFKEKDSQKKSSSNQKSLTGGQNNSTNGLAKRRSNNRS